MCIRFEGKLQLLQLQNTIIMYNEYMCKDRFISSNNRAYDCGMTNRVKTKKK